ncbi:MULTISPECIES: flagellar basal-body MS-ring/collar protein FliF [Sphingomonas]|uniref:Flagellar M-ring protein n=1 Tax=Edaphosphingomonas fennica TaxID=114404 RepID=A0A2T4I7K8_9SPHN|nr:MULTISPECIES: flagellar basal-body MS-ring/collar protein FliF [Sphingomonas]MDX3884486.1 flagellar basal-body MS-ring/collar protein FliF [Sphingomonas sp.]PTD27305.1 flagellar M-ring protein FliF [Sphingomonas fennica]
MADIAVSNDAAPGRALAIPAAGRPPMGPMLDRLKGMMEQPAVQRSLPMIGLVAMLGLAALAWMAFSQAPQRDLFRGLADGDKAAVADALKSAGVDYHIDRDTGTLTVSDGDFYRARMLLAQAGLPKSAPDGDAMISALPMGASRAVEGERLRGARELDLARTIEQIDAVAAARVHLAVEQPSVFLRESRQTAASVMLQLQPGRSLGDAQVKAIAHLVASSVPGLSAEGVSIVDQSGKLLSGGGGDAATDASERQIDIQAKMESRYREALDKLLIPIVGPGNYTAEVHADLDFAEVQATRESYPKDLATVRAEQGGWTKEGGPDGPDAVGGVPGAIANTPPPASQVAAQPNGAMTPPVPGAPNTGATAAQSRTTENYNRTFELGREVSVTRNPVGTVRRLSVAVALRDVNGKARPRAELVQIEDLVKGAVGFDQQRGDTIAVNSRKFADTDVEAVGAKWWDAPWVGLAARNLSALMIAALLVFGIARPLLKRRIAAAAQRAKEEAAAREAQRALVGREIAATIADESRIDPNRTVTLDMIEATPGYAERAELIRGFVRQDPARAALVVRDLIRADNPSGDARNG